MGFRDRRFGDREFSRDRRDRGFSRDRDRGDRRDRKEMHTVTCDKCGKQCEVPFKPTEGKPVYCSECFEKEHPEKSRNARSSSGISPEQFNQLNEKLDKILSILEQAEFVEEDSEEEK